MGNIFGSDSLIMNNKTLIFSLVWPFALFFIIYSYRIDVYIRNNNITNNKIKSCNEAIQISSYIMFVLSFLFFYNACYGIYHDKLENVYQLYTAFTIIYYISLFYCSITISNEIKTEKFKIDADAVKNTIDSIFKVSFSILIIAIIFIILKASGFNKYIPEGTIYRIYTDGVKTEKIYKIKDNEFYINGKRDKILNMNDVTTLDKGYCKCPPASTFTLKDCPKSKGIRIVQDD